MLPATSVPMPSGEPWRARSAASPPVEPPHERSGRMGPRVSPNIGLEHSMLKGKKEIRIFSLFGQYCCVREEALRHVGFHKGNSSLV